MKTKFEGSLKNQVVTPRLNASGYLRPRDTRSGSEIWADRLFWVFLVFAFLYFGGHVFAAVLRGTF